MDSSLSQKRKRVSDKILYFFIYLSAAFSVLLLAGIIVYVFVKGLPVVNWQFLTSVRSALEETAGIAGNIINTLYIIIITLIIATPIGIGSAIYLNEYAKPGRFVNVIEFTTETLAGIPSIIYGLFGMVFFGNTLGLEYSILTGSLTLSLMVLPLITRNTQEALKTVPASWRSGALGLGSEKWHMIRTILLPCASSGIITGVILAIGRIVGESAALLFTAGSGYLLPRSVFSKIFESGGTLTIELYLSMSKGEYDTAFGVAAVLVIIVLLINLLTHAITRKFDITRRINNG